MDAFIEEGSLFLQLILSGQMRFGATAADTFSNMSISVNANVIGYYSVSGMSSAIALLVKEKQTKSGYEKRKNSIILWLAFIWIFFVGALTISRAWMIVTIICTAIYVVSCNKNILKLIKTIISIMFIAFIIIYIIGSYTSILDSFILRFEGEAINTAGGRTTITSQYLFSYFKSNLFMLLGTGVTDYTNVLNMTMSLHTGLIQILVCMGIPCAIIFIKNLVSPLLAAWKNGISLIWWIPIISIILFTQTIQFLNPYMLMLPYVVGIYTLYMGNEIAERRKYVPLEEI